MQLKSIQIITVLILVIITDFVSSSGAALNSTTVSKNSKSNKKQSKTGKRRQEKSVKPTTSLPIVQNEPEFDSLITNNYNDQFIANQETIAALRKASSSAIINVTAILGQSAFLPCVVRNIGTYNILWLRVRDGDVLAFDDMLITQDPRFKLIKKSRNESNLLIQNVKLNDVGEYLCQINTEKTKSKTVHLNILSKNKQIFFILS
jgi:hypothetical protein